MPEPITTLFGGLSPEEFLRDYWQKKPLLIRRAFPDMQPPLTPEELAGLSLEEDVASRLVQLTDGADQWSVRYGPFEPDEIEGLPEKDWSLLVHEVDQLHPEAARVLDSFRFIPNWRIDDLMVSYATPGGGVGAHIDSYDVFLIQALGRRRWQIAYEPVDEEVLVPDVDVRVLADFQPDEDWTLEPGDMLYLPPRIAHNGIAVDPCMTLSVGFRAPSHVDLLNGYLAHLTEYADPDARYGDPGLQPHQHPGEISGDALETLWTTLLAYMDDEEEFRSWFGRSVTEPKRGRYVMAPDEPVTPRSLRTLLEQGTALQRPGIGQFAYIEHDDRSVSLFTSGEEFRLEREMTYAARLLTGPTPLNREHLGPYLDDADFLHLLAELVNDGLIALHE